MPPGELEFHPHLIQGEDKGGLERAKPPSSTDSPPNMNDPAPKVSNKFTLRCSCVFCISSIRMHNIAQLVLNCF